MKILLFGGSGQLGFDIVRRATDLNFEMVAPVSSEVNVINHEQVAYLVDHVRPAVIINCAAYTNVDGAEQHPADARAVNVEGVRFIAEAAKRVRARVISISTDYVFDGKKGTPYIETDSTAPLNVYGETKRDGEKILLDTLAENALVVRTSWLHGSRGKNFVQTLIKLFREKDELYVVNDQFGSPTWTGWLAEVVLDLCRIPTSGIVHAACHGITNWHEFASEILQLVCAEIPDCRVKEITPQSSKELKRPAERPAFSVLDCTHLQGMIGRAPMGWREGLRAHLHELGFQCTAAGNERT
jgi:dTDP-4-dehydrorhamnose reductase